MFDRVVVASHLLDLPFGDNCGEWGVPRWEQNFYQHSLLVVVDWAHGRTGLISLKDRQSNVPSRPVTKIRLCGVIKKSVLASGRSALV